MNRDMNFFSQFEGEKKEVKNKNIYIYSLVTIILVFIIGTLAWNSIGIVLAKKDIKKYETELSKEEVKNKVLVWEDLVKNESLLKAYSDELNIIIGNLESRAIVTTNFLDKISSTIPTEVTIGAISITNNEISIQAISTSRKAIGEIENNLKNLDNIQKVYVGGIAGTEQYTFDIKCVLKDVE